MVSVHDHPRNVLVKGVNKFFHQFIFNRSFAVISKSQNHLVSSLAQFWTTMNLDFLLRCEVQVGNKQ